MLITLEEKDGKVFVTVPNNILSKVMIKIGDDTFHLKQLINTFAFKD